MSPTTKTRYYIIAHHAINDEFIIQSSFSGVGTFHPSGASEFNPKR